MSGSNGNGHKAETSVAFSVSRPGRNGGVLRNGGGNPKRNGGRTPSALRDKMRGALATRVKIAQAIADDTEASHADRLRALDFLAKYGLGTTVTETDTEGQDVPRGRLTPAEIRAEVLRIMGQ